VARPPWTALGDLGNPEARFTKEHRVMGSLTRLLLVTVMLVGLGAALSACGDTWSGMKQDTGENLEKTGEALEKAGEKVSP
jgi:hypothetical protein